MPTNKLTIVPVKLDPLSNETSSFHSSQYTDAPSCVIKTDVAEIAFFNGVDERIIHTIMKELKVALISAFTSRSRSGQSIFFILRDLYK